MRLTRTGWLVTTLAAVSTYVLAPDAPVCVRALTGTSYPDALIALASLVQLALSGWVLLTVLLSVAGRSSRIARAVAPAAVRRALFVGAVGALTLAPAHADEFAAPSGQAAHSVDGLRLPDRPAAPGTTAPTPRRAHPQADPVVVRAGDTLWGIAARSLPSDASPADVGHAVARWHAANRGVIGPEPDLIFPGQHLTPPIGKDHP
ncbi:LysM peptidoglycan-binding domain-containing protein [Aeromicrobium chenweiae]|uniref:Uncharacterized protein n=1 Tax=Aeromicrobium chenweiae TaxID=2079793 RepID=A0A2S0WNT5_9ACTN|nr:LysM domain-containing protein [Aeromicrobium chenweiae]AWB93008.1 hypothetical protein C3E78_12770 [Aeromicrobium chenweiae]TGN33998.1 LysM domain-containing protein [Aeromicrobium chenweiae]